ncbi:protein FAR1-RELATED SEQUENCE 5-like [Spinacia oleracea]|uniref:Protein FAR1-RELATED SEQUENCE n=1 Tax=Spinacia oleracea TaxID=3562 RepID=A0ABM3RPE1_SPIOL|nr:protein FAR1-RELATED SEQUENCE 5-like [Spinacia oleracea]
MDNKDGQVDIVGKIVIDLNIDYPSECDSSESTNTILCIDLESDVMRHAINGDDNIQNGFEMKIRSTENGKDVDCGNSNDSQGNAIKDVFHEAKYRWCIFHIVRNFEKIWGEILEKYKLQSINLFNDMFNLRHRWVPVYFKDDFCAGMSSTQRIESMNNFFKAFVNLNTSLKDFVHQYCLALGKRANDEDNENLRSINKPTLHFTEYVSKGMFQQLYTSKKFDKFQDQKRLMTYTSAKKFQDDEGICVYDVVTKKDKWP